MYLEEKNSLYFIYIFVVIMTRSFKKWFYINKKLLKKIKKMEEDWNKKVIKVWDRASQISPEMIWYTFAVHSWKQFVSVYVSEEMIWHRLWEFVPTRVFRWHPF